MLTKILLLSGIGGLLGLDVTAFLQSMVSRPIVICPVMGYFFGDVSMGVYMGILIELIWINQIPVGGWVIPDSAVAGVVASSVYGLTFRDPAIGSVPIMALSVIAGVSAGYIAGRFDVLMRKLNGVFVGRAVGRIKSGKCGGMGSTICACVASSFIKSSACCFVFIYAGYFTLTYLRGIFSDKVKSGLSIFTEILPALGFAVIIEMYGIRNALKILPGILLVIALSFFVKVDVRLNALIVVASGFVVFWLSDYVKGRQPKIRPDRVL